MHSVLYYLSSHCFLFASSFPKVGAIKLLHSIRKLSFRLQCDMSIQLSTLVKTRTNTYQLDRDCMINKTCALQTLGGDDKKHHYRKHIRSITSTTITISAGRVEKEGKRCSQKNKRKLLSSANTFFSFLAFSSEPN